MSKQITNSQNQKIIKAVKELLTQQEINEYLQELDLMHGAFLRSDFADDRDVRSQVVNTYENIRAFLIAVSDVNHVRLAV